MRSTIHQHRPADQGQGAFCSTARRTSWLKLARKHTAGPHLRAQELAERVQVPQKTNTVSSDESDGELLDWKAQWYPAAIERDLQPDRPHSVVILGRRLVLWRDDNKDWHAFDDKCPHRAVRLSEGRIDGGELHCTYHGWQFGGDGKCSKIPQLYKESDNAAGVAQPRSAATTFPVGEKNGLLWVWMEPGADAALKASQVPITCSSAPNTKWFMRDLDYSWQVLGENINDPSHVPYSHHGVQGDRNKPRPVEYAGVERRGADGYAAIGKWRKMGSGKPAARGNVNMIHAPTAHDIEFQTCENPEAPEEEWKGVNRACLMVRMVPVTPSTSRLFAGTVVPAIQGTWKEALFNAKPEWIKHMERNAVLDGDGIFLHAQSQDLLAGKGTTKDYYLPASADEGVRELYKWMRKHAPNGPDFYPDALTTGELDGYKSREQVLDRYSQHTQHCKPCRVALANVRRGMLAAQFVATVALATAAALIVLGQPWLSVRTGACVAAAAVGAATWRVLKGLQARLTFTDYVHAER